MQIKIHDAYRKIVALSDVELLGKTFEEGKRQIYLRENFFSGEKKTKEEVIKILKLMDQEDATFNIVGEKSIQAAIEAGVISEDGVFYIQGIPIALGLM